MCSRCAHPELYYTAMMNRREARGSGAGLRSRKALLNVLRCSVLALAFVLVAACEPCAGTSPCGSIAPRLTLSGQIVRAEDGRGVDGIRIDVVRVGGAAFSPDSLSVVTSAGGFWQVDAPISGEQSGDAVVDVTVHTPTMEHPYIVRGVHVKPVTRAGEAVLLDRWVANPYIPAYVDFYLRGSESPIVSAGVDFKPTSGPALYGPGVSEDGVAHTGTDPNFGRAQFFVLQAFVKDTGDIVGDVTVNIPEPYGPSVRHGVRLSPTHLYRAPGVVMRLGAGPSLEYAAQLYDRATGRVLPNVPFTLHRVSGVSLQDPDLTGTSDAQGYVRIHGRPLGTGKLVADITIQHPYGPEVRRDTLATFEDDFGKFAGNWLAGPVLPYYGLLRANAHDLIDVPVRVRRTGGVEVSPSDTIVRTNIFGGVPISPVPHGDGTVTLELTFMPPAPLPSFILKNLVLPVVRKEAPLGINIWIWEIADRLDGPPGTIVERLP